MGLMSNYNGLVRVEIMHVKTHGCKGLMIKGLFMPITGRPIGRTFATGFGWGDPPPIAHVHNGCCGHNYSDHLSEDYINDDDYLLDEDDYLVED